MVTVPNSPVMLLKLLHNYRLELAAVDYFLKSSSGFQFVALHLEELRPPTVIGADRNRLEVDLYEFITIKIYKNEGFLVIVFSSFIS